MAISKKAFEVTGIIVMLIVGLVVLGMLIYLGYKYILGTGESVGQLGSCEGQGGTCNTKCEETQRSFFGLGCPKKEGGADKYCCLPKQPLT